MRTRIATLALAFLAFFTFNISPAAAAVTVDRWTPESTCVLPVVRDALVKTGLDIGSNNRDWAVKVSARQTGSVGAAPMLTSGTGEIFQNGTYRGFTEANFHTNDGTVSTTTTYQNGGVARGSTFKISWVFHNYYGSTCIVVNTVTAP